MKFIEQTRTHTPAQTDFVRQKFLDIPYAPEDSVPYVSRSPRAPGDCWISICPMKEMVPSR